MPIGIHRSLKCFLLVVLSLSFAGTYFAAQTGGARSDSCSYLTKAEVQEALGKPVKDGKKNTSANPAVGAPCEYIVGDYGVFSLLVMTLGPSDTPDKYLATFKKNNMKTEDAPGIGDKSFFTFPGYGMLQLNSFKGSKYVLMTMMVPGLTEDAEKPPAAKLMKMVLPKL